MSEPHAFYQLILEQCFSKILGFGYSYAVESSETVIKVQILILYAYVSSWDSTFLASTQVVQKVCI